MRALILLAMMLAFASPVKAGAPVMRMLRVMQQPSYGPFTTSPTGAFTIPIDWYQDAAATTQGAAVSLSGGGGGGQPSQGVAGYAGDLVAAVLTPGSYTAYLGYGGQGGDYAGGGSIGGAGYAAGTNGGGADGAGAGSSAITNGGLVAQAKGGDSGAGIPGGGTSSGGTVTPNGGAPGGLGGPTSPSNGLTGSNGWIRLTHYTDPGNFQTTGFETGTEGWTFSTGATRDASYYHTGSYGAYLYESTYNTAEYSISKTITTRAGVMSVWIAKDWGGNTPSGVHKVTIGGTTYTLSDTATGWVNYKFNVPAGSTLIKFWFTGHALYHYAMAVDDIKVPVP